MTRLRETSAAPAKGRTKKDDTRARSAAALRENLKRRKVQARSKAEGHSAADDQHDQVRKPKP